VSCSATILFGSLPRWIAAVLWAVGVGWSLRESVVRMGSKSTVRSRRMFGLGAALTLLVVVAVSGGLLGASDGVAAARPSVGSSALTSPVYVAGTGGVGSEPPDGGAPSVVALFVQYPDGVAADKAGSLYVADSDNSRVLKVPVAGGSASVVSTGAYPLSTPKAVAVDGAGDLFIADSDNRRVVEVPADGGAPLLVDLGGETLDDPTALAIDKSGDLYIADTGDNRVLEVPSGGEAPIVLADAGAPKPYLPVGLAVDSSGDLFIADQTHSEVRELASGASTTSLVDTGSIDLGDVEGVALDSTGDLFITDSAEGEIVEVPSGSGSPNVVDTGTINLDEPAGVTVDASGDLLIADTYHSRIVKVPAGGAGTASVLTTGFKAVNAPGGVAENAAGDVFIADTGDGVVLKLPASGGSAVTWGGPLYAPASAVAVGPDGSVYVVEGAVQGAVLRIPPDGGTAAAVSTAPYGLTYPSGLAVDTAGDVFVTSGQQLIEVPGNGATPHLVSTAPYAVDLKSGLAVDSAGAVFIADPSHNQVVVVPPNGGPAASVSTGGEQLSGPSGVAVDSVGDLVIADTQNNRVLVVPGNGRSPYTLSADQGTPWSSPLAIAIRPVEDPTITAQLKSRHPKSTAGWYRSPVTATFTCTSGSAPLEAPCPSPITLTASKAAQSLHATVAATDGGSATVALSKINIDRIAPSLRVTGAVSGHTYRHLRSLHCSAHDALSGLQRACTITRSRHRERHHDVIRYRASATDRAGNTTTIRGHYKISAGS
jgi:sugar lactone lactonase YvrE